MHKFVRVLDKYDALYNIHYDNYKIGICGAN